jgi:hypothetical protein
MMQASGDMKLEGWIFGIPVGLVSGNEHLHLIVSRNALSVHLNHNVFNLQKYASFFECEQMKDIVSSFGEQAGTVWHTLHERGPLSESDLLNYTHFTEQQLYAAIGWLARENKIRKENDTYLLGETNLVPIIGKDAGKIWRTLEIWGEVDVLSLSRLSRIVELDVFTAVGWLAREGKVDGAIRNIDEKKILFWLK